MLVSIMVDPDVAARWRCFAKLVQRNVMENHLQNGSSRSRCFVDFSVSLLFEEKCQTKQKFNLFKTYQCNRYRVQNVF